MNKHGRCVIRKEWIKKKKQSELAPCQLEALDCEISSISLDDVPERTVYEVSPVVSDVQKLIVCADDFITWEILSRLPVKSLMRFKCVCKRWKSIIQKDEFFIDLHLSRSKAANRVSLARMGTLRLKDMLDDKKCLVIMELLLPSEENGGVASVGDASLWKHTLPKAISRSCSTNGLLCVMDLIEFCVCIYNMSTRDSTPWIKAAFIKEKEDKKQKPRYGDIWLNGFGLGYDPVTKEHKVIALWRIFATNKLVCEVLTVRHNKWRRINAVLPQYFYEYTESVHVNGFICWLHFDRHYGDSCFILFEVGSEIFHKISILPLDPIDDYRLSLIDIDGQLAILSTGPEPVKLYIATSTTNSDASNPSCDYYWMEETFSKPYNSLPQQIPRTDLLMGRRTDDDFSFYYYNWKTKSYNSCKMNFEISAPFYYYSWKKKSYSSCKIDSETLASSFNGRSIQDIVFTPTLFPVN